MPPSWAVGLALPLGAAVAYLWSRLWKLEEELAKEVAHRNALALDILGSRNRLMNSAKSIEIGRAMIPRKNDVFIVTYPKCGTTWMMQICHALRSHADMNFDEITEVVPWEVLAHDCGQDLNADQPGGFRLFKSHEAYATVPKGARYIYVVRDPLDAFFSFYQFLPSYTGLGPNDIDQIRFADGIFAGMSHSGQIWHHYLGWWQQRKSPDVLFVFFEDLLADLEGEIRRVARFLNIDLSEELLASVAHVSSYSFMSDKANAHHFDDHFVRSFAVPRMGLPDEALPVRVSKVRSTGGKQGTGSKLLPAVRKRLEDRWSAVLEGPTGCTNYSEFRQAVRSGL